METHPYVHHADHGGHMHALGLVLIAALAVLCATMLDGHKPAPSPDTVHAPF